MFRLVAAIIRFFSFESIKIILYNLRGGVFDEEISTSKPLLEHSTSILGVLVSHVIIQKRKTYITRTKTKNKKQEGSVLGMPLVVSSFTPPRELYRIILSDLNDKT